MKNYAIESYKLTRKISWRVVGAFTSWFIVSAIIWINYLNDTMKLWVAIVLQIFWCVLLWLAYEVSTAPEGFEDSNGFHELKK